jgi:exodeoxyribonuclease VII large subunit
MIKQERLQLRNLQTRLAHATRSPVDKARYRLVHLSARLSAHLPDTRSHRVTLKDFAHRLGLGFAARRSSRQQGLASLQAQLELLNPQRTLDRGYALITDSRGNIVRAPRQLKPRENLSVRLAQGSVEIGIASVQETLD